MAHKKSGGHDNHRFFAWHTVCSTGLRTARCLILLQLRQLCCAHFAPGAAAARHIGVVLAGLLLLALTTVASLAQFGTPPAGPVVKDIKVEYVGPETISRERVLANPRIPADRNLPTPNGPQAPAY